MPRTHAGRPFQKRTCSGVLLRAGPSSVAGARCDRCYASHLERVQRDTGIYYRVRQGLGPVEARTQYVSSLERSLDMLVALTRVQAAVRAKVAALCMEDVEQFVGAFESACLSLATKLGFGSFLCMVLVSGALPWGALRKPEMQLSFRAVLHCSMRLEGPYTKLRNALHHRLHLIRAAGRGWPFLREALTEMRRCPNKRRLRTLSVTEAAASVDGAYAKLSGTFVGKRFKARLERVSRATEARLEIASKASVAARRRQVSAKLAETCQRRLSARTAAKMKAVGAGVREAVEAGFDRSSLSADAKAAPEVVAAYLERLPKVPMSESPGCVLFC
eukprot:s5917_g2.t1